MVKRTADDPTSRVLAEMAQQPAALTSLANHYLADGDLETLPNLTAPLLFTGMGASYHAALMAADQCCRGGVNARAVETAALLAWPEHLLSESGSIVCISQSGASREVTRLVEKVERSRLTAITNDPASPLALAAGAVLPLLAGDEKWIASKTLINSLALVWCLGRRLTGHGDGCEADQLKRVRQRIQVMLEAGESLRGRWLSLLPDPQRLILVGSGPQEISARQTSLMLAEWAKLSAPAFSLDSFRHGNIELLDAGATVLWFQSSASVDGEALRLLEATGAGIVHVFDGFPQASPAPNQPAVGIDPGLTPILDIVSAQLLAVELAYRRGCAGFRYLTKVVR
jgi:glucosamine--fructose-6-phosphate aminotransferase (isomerizing)